MNRIHKLVNQPITEYYTYSGDLSTYTIAIVKHQLFGGTIMLESWYAQDGDGIARHACGVENDTEEDEAILLNEAIELIKQDEQEQQDANNNN